MQKARIDSHASIEIYTKFGLSTDYVFTVEGRNLVPVGVNVVDGKRIKEKALEEEIFVVNNERVIMNVNTSEDLRIAEHMLQSRSQ